MRSPNPSLIAYIEQHISKGFDIKDIKRKLAEAGHPIEAIEDAATVVLGTKHPKRGRIPKFMLIYGLILIFLISAGIWFFWFKATEYQTYSEVVEDTSEQIALNDLLKSLNDTELILYAKSNSDSRACDYIADHDLKYLCIDKYWETEPCFWRRFLGEDIICEGKICVGTLRSELGACMNETFEAAVAKKDPGLCNEDYNCLYYYFENYPSEEFCKNTAKNKDDCYSFLGDLLDDISFCDFINDSEYKIECMERSVSSISQIRDLCMHGVMLEHQSILENTTGVSPELDSLFSCYIILIDNMVDSVDGEDVSPFADAETCDLIRSFINSEMDVDLRDDFIIFIKDTEYECGLV